MEIKMVNVKGTAKQPIMFDSVLYQRGEKIDAVITAELRSQVGEAFFYNMIDDYVCVTIGQRPTTETVEEKLVVENIQPQAEQEELKASDEVVSDAIEKKPAQRGRPAKTK